MEYRPRHSTIAVLALVAACLGAAPARATTEQLTVEGPDLIRMMDTTAPKYATAECEASRAIVSKMDNNLLGQVALGAALGLLGPVGIIIAADADEKERNRVTTALDELYRACGEEAFIPYFQSRAEKGDDGSMAWLGQLYTRGVRGKPDGAMAEHWYALAVARGNTAAEVNLGVMYWRGDLVPRDAARAEELWRKASEDGSPEGKINLGELYKEAGRYDDAHRQFAAAARLGHAHGQFDLAELYEQGLGVERNDKTAYFWFSVSALNGYARATERRDAIEARLPAGSVNYLKSQITTCKVQGFKSCSYGR